MSNKPEHISWKAGIDNALEFLCLHEGLHLGYIMALKRLILKNIQGSA